MLGVALCAFACRKQEPPPPQPAAVVRAPAVESRLIHAARATASSSQPPSAGYTYGPDNLVDGALTTSWQPAKADRGPYWIKLELPEDVTVTAVGIANGFQTTDRFGDEFLLNRRIARARLRFDDATELPVQLDASTRGTVQIPVPRKTTRALTLLVDETHPGRTWNDLAVSELEIHGFLAPQIAAATAAPAAPSPTWWVPPRVPRQDLEALAHGFAGIDEHDLGRPFTSDLKPVDGAPNLFEAKPPRRVARGEMQHLVVKLRSSSQLDAGFNYLFAKAGLTRSAEHDYQVARAMQIREVVRLDDTARMIAPPPEATFYLAEVHLGSSFDLLVEGDHAAMGAKLEVALAAGGRLADLRESSSYRLSAFGLGLDDVSGDGIFALSADQIAQRYRTGTVVPVQLVFRVIPGRRYHAEELPVPQPVVDQPRFHLPEGAYQTWTVPPGHYRLLATSEPNGINLAWLAGDVTCNQSLHSTTEYRSIEMACDLGSSAELQVTNPTSSASAPPKPSRSTSAASADPQPAATASSLWSQAAKCGHVARIRSIPIACSASRPCSVFWYWFG